MRPWDLIIAGAGIVGTACAHAASRAGLRVAVVEPAEVAGGATAAGMGHLVALDHSPAELALARYALQAWQPLLDEFDAGFERCGTLWVADDDGGLAVLRGKAVALAAAGIEASALDAATLREAEPALAHDLAGGLLVPGEGVVYPPGFTRALLDDVCRSGGQLFAGRRVVALEDGAAVLDDGTRLCGPVLVACGCDTPALLPELAVRRRRGHLVVTHRYPGWLRHQVVETGYAASTHAEGAESVACNVQPRPGGQLLVGSSRENGRDDIDICAPLLARMLQRCFRFLPGLARMKALRSWTGFRPATPDGLPYIGALPSRSHVWVAAGHEGLGVTTAPGTAQLFLDLFLGRATGIDPSPFAPTRGMA